MILRRRLPGSGRLAVAVLCVLGAVQAAPASAVGISLWQACGLSLPENDAPIRDPEDFRGSWRVLAVIGPAHGDPDYRAQLSALVRECFELNRARTVIADDWDPAANSRLRQQMAPASFGIYLFDIDGTLVFEADHPVAVDALLEVIEALPSRANDLR